MAGSEGVAVPDSWHVVRLGDVADLRREQVKPERDDLRPYVALEHISSEGGLNGYGRAAESISNKTLFQKGDTLYGKLRPNLRKVIRAEFDGVCSTDILALFARERTNGLFLSHLLRSERLHRHAMRGVAGTKMPRTSWSHLGRFRVFAPGPPRAGRHRRRARLHRRGHRAHRGDHRRHRTPPRRPPPRAPHARPPGPPHRLARRPRPRHRPRLLGGGAAGRCGHCRIWPSGPPGTSISRGFSSLRQMTWNLGLGG